MSNICKNWTQWLSQTRFAHMNEVQIQQTFNWLFALRDIVISKANIKAGDKVIDIGCGSGLLAFGVIEKFKDSVDIIFSDKFEDCLEECKKLLSQCDVPNKATFLQSDCLDIKLPDFSVDKPMTRSVLVHIVDKQKAINEIYRILKKGGTYSAFEPIIKSNTRYHELTSPDEITDWQAFKEAEDDFMSDINDPLTNFDAQSIAQNLDIAGFSDGDIDVQDTPSTYVAQKDSIIKWFDSAPSPDRPTSRERFLKYFDEKKVNNYILEVQKALGGKTITVNSKTIFIRATK